MSPLVADLIDSVAERHERKLRLRLRDVRKASALDNCEMPITVGELDAVWRKVATLRSYAVAIRLGHDGVHERVAAIVEQWVDVVSALRVTLAFCGIPVQDAELTFPLGAAA